jgi:hypothetical protein
MVATAEVSKNVSFFQLSISSVNDSEKIQRKIYLKIKEIKYCTIS